jgi:GINS complex subunit 1
VRDLDRDVKQLLAPYDGGSGFDPAADPATACALLVDHLAMRRNKRCLLAYHRVRADRIEEGVWAGREVDAGIASVDGGAEGTGSLSPEEEEYQRLFAELLAAYKGHWTDVDLTGGLEPPRDLFVYVRVLKDAGEIQTEYG